MPGDLDLVLLLTRVLTGVGFGLFTSMCLSMAASNALTNALLSSPFSMVKCSSMRSAIVCSIAVMLLGFC